jgi:hypothetical protein
MPRAYGLAAACGWREGQATANLQRAQAKLHPATPMSPQTGVHLQCPAELVSRVLCLSSADAEPAAIFACPYNYALAGPSLRGGSAVPQPECGQRQAGECYQRAYDLKSVVV